MRSYNPLSSLRRINSIRRRYGRLASTGDSVLDVPDIYPLAVVCFSYMLLNVIMIAFFSSSLCELSICRSMTTDSTWGDWQSILQLAVAFNLGALSILTITKGHEDNVRNDLANVRSGLFYTSKELQEYEKPTGFIDDAGAMESEISITIDGDSRYAVDLAEEMSRYTALATSASMLMKAEDLFWKKGLVWGYFIILELGITATALLIYSTYNKADQIPFTVTLASCLLLLLTPILAVFASIAFRLRSIDPVRTNIIIPSNRALSKARALIAHVKLQESELAASRKKAPGKRLGFGRPLSSRHNVAQRYSRPRP